MLVAAILVACQTQTRSTTTGSPPAAHTVAFETDEGTMMSVDVSPDGKEIAFGMLGDIYTVPIAGGDATLLLSGPAFESSPRYSPDGSKIAFLSDRSGQDAVWTVDRNGQNPMLIASAIGKSFAHSSGRRTEPSSACNGTGKWAR